MRSISIVLAGVLLLGSCSKSTEISGRIEVPSQEEFQSKLVKKRTFKKLLLSNGVKALLISDPNVEKSAAAASMGVGTLSDPEDAGGMAHYLEHMLFLGTKKYPSAGEYKSFLDANGGGSNAYTAPDHTNYYFDVSNEKYEEALDRFSQFFISPLFDPTFAEKEKNAVSQEHDKNKDNDGWRFQALRRFLMKEEHPISKFGTGNVETLANVSRDRVVKFYNDHYSSERMTVVLISSSSIGELEELARSKFSAVPRRNLPKIEVDSEIMVRKKALRWIHLDPIEKGKKELAVEFFLPSINGYYKEKPAQVISTLLGGEHPGSLSQILKNDGLAVSVGADTWEETNYYTTYMVQVELTNDGVKRAEEVVQKVLSAIEFLKENQLSRSVFEEMKATADLAFKYEAFGEVGSAASGYSRILHYYPFDAIPDAVFSFDHFEPSVYSRFLDYLTPDNMIVVQMSENPAADTPIPFYNGSYSYSEKAGDAYDALVNIEIDSRFKMPQESPFVPKDEAIKPIGGEIRITDATILRLEREKLSNDFLKFVDSKLKGNSYTNLADFLKGAGEKLAEKGYGELLESLYLASSIDPYPFAKTEMYELWNVPKIGLSEPKAFIYLDLITSKTTDTVKNSALTTLYADAIMESFSELRALASRVGLSVDVRPSQFGIRLVIGFLDRRGSPSGGVFSSSALEFLNEVSSRLKEITISEAFFDQIREKKVVELEGIEFAGNTYEKTLYLKDRFLGIAPYSREERLAALKGVQYSEVLSFAQNVLFDQVFVRGVVTGNLDDMETEAAVARLVSNLKARKLDEQPVFEVNRLQPGERLIDRSCSPKGDSAMFMYAPLGEYSDERTFALSRLLEVKLGADFYTEMRTKQQLGYIVFGATRAYGGVWSLLYIIQSGQYDAATLLERADAFYPGYVSELENVSDQEFQGIQSGLVTQLLERKTEMGQIVGGTYLDAGAYKDIFVNKVDVQFLDRVLNELRALKKEDLAAFYRDLVHPSKERWVSLVFGANHAEAGSCDAPVR